MDHNQRGLLLNWTYNFYQEKSMDEIAVLSMEVEEIRVKAEEELKMRDLEIAHLKALLSKAIKERDEAHENCQKACFENAILQKQLQKRRHHSSTPHDSGNISSIEFEDDPRRGIIEQYSNNGFFSSSDGDESIGSSPPRSPAAPLPEKGKLLQAVIKAGPLLQTLLLAGGPLPQWRHPPPPLDTYHIPPPPVVVPPSTMSIHGNNININTNDPHGPDQLCFF